MIKRAYEQEKEDPLKKVIYLGSINDCNDGYEEASVKVKEDIKFYFDGESLVEEYFVDVFTQ